MNSSKAAIFVHNEFHPHLIKNPFSAFCRSNDTKNKLKEIREKGSFTNDWMSELLSIGLFYVNDFDTLKKPIFDMINNKNVINGEYFPSLLYNYLLAEEISVDLLVVKSFVHYGTPEQLEDFLFWTDHFLVNINKRFVKSINHNKYAAIVLASGTGSRMKSISSNPKPLIKHKDMHLIKIVMDNLPIKSDILPITAKPNEAPNFTIK